jgi:hypothetical protein
MQQESVIKLRDLWAERLRTERLIAWESASASKESLEPRIAIGITGADNNYRLAIRVQDLGAATAEATAKMIATMSEEAKGEVDVREIGEVRGLALRVRPLMGGISVGNQFGNPGTLGCAVRKRGTDEPLFILSNNHVLARLNFAEAHEVVEQPAASEQAGSGPFEIAEFGETVTLNPSENVNAARNFVDAAIVPLLSGVACDRRALFGTTARLAGQRMADLREHESVFKVGKTTNKTTGTIKAWGISLLSVQLGSQLFDFDDQIEIMPNVVPFCADGDSGSIIVDTANLAVGLLFSKSVLTERAYANPIGRVFNDLDIELA